jgi:hypothetical protein
LSIWQAIHYRSLDRRQLGRLIFVIFKLLFVFLFRHVGKDFLSDVINFFIGFKDWSSCFCIKLYPLVVSFLNRDVFLSILENYINVSFPSGKTA